jgi:dihydroorotase-like cyclic amidohydrolase
MAKYLKELGKEPNLPKGDVNIDVKGKLVIPGLVDVHVHFREPGRTHKEDFLTGSMAASAGGVTTVVDEPNVDPPTISLETLEEKRKLAEKSLVDYSFTIGLNPDNIGLIPEFALQGIHSFTIFDEMEGPLLNIPDIGTFIEALEAVQESKVLASLNCRYADLRTWFKAKIREVGGRTIEDFAKASPPIAETLGAKKNLLLARDLGIKAHLREISSEKTLQILEQLKTPLTTAEVTPNHLFLTEKDAKTLGPYAQLPPPLRRERC